MVDVSAPGDSAGTSRSRGARYGRPDRLVVVFIAFFIATPNS